MKRNLILLAAMLCLLLCGCGWMDGSYLSITPHQGQNATVQVKDRSASNYLQLRQALEDSRALGGRTVLEQFVEGRECSIAVLEGHALPAIEIIPKAGFYDYANKYQAGAATEVCPADIPAQWEERMGRAALEVFHTLGLSVYSRADFILAPDATPYFLEINTLPGMTPTSLVPQEAAAVGIGYGELCERIIYASLKARNEGV